MRNHFPGFFDYLIFYFLFFGMAFYSIVTMCPGFVLVPVHPVRRSQAPYSTVDCLLLILGYRSVL